MRRVLEASDHNLETLKVCDSRKAQSYRGPGVYVHVIYIPNDPEGVRVDVGSAVYVSSESRDISGLEGTQSGAIRPPIIGSGINWARGTFGS